jgi:hypothetical protein
MVRTQDQIADGRRGNPVRKGREAMRKYNPNPKHELPGTQGRKGTKLDLSLSGLWVVGFVLVGQDGDVVGLPTVYPICRNDPYHRCTKRIDLSALAEFMERDGIDDSIVHSERIGLSPDLFLNALKLRYPVAKSLRSQLHGYVALDAPNVGRGVRSRAAC